MADLTPRQIRHLRSLGHHLKPVVMIGDAGLSEAVLSELDGALSHHELVKVRMRGGDRQARDTMVTTMERRMGCSAVQRLGHTTLLYRRNPERPRIRLP